MKFTRILLVATAAISLSQIANATEAAAQATAKRQQPTAEIRGDITCLVRKAIYIRTAHNETPQLHGPMKVSFTIEREGPKDVAFSPALPPLADALFRTALFRIRYITPGSERIEFSATFNLDDAAKGDRDHYRNAHCNVRSPKQTSTQSMLLSPNVPSLTASAIYEAALSVAPSIDMTMAPVETVQAFVLFNNTANGAGANSFHTTLWEYRPLLTRFLSKNFLADWDRIRDAGDAFDGNMITGSQNAFGMTIVDVLEAKQLAESAFEVKVTFHEQSSEDLFFGKIQRATFLLLRQGGAWRIDEVLLISRIEQNASKPANAVAVPIGPHAYVASIAASAAAKSRRLDPSPDAAGLAKRYPWSVKAQGDLSASECNSAMRHDANYWWSMGKCHMKYIRYAAGVALRDTRALEDPSSVRKKGDLFSPTQYRPDEDSYCEHGGYCYPAKDIKLLGSIRTAPDVTDSTGDKDIDAYQGVTTSCEILEEDRANILAAHAQDLFRDCR